MWTASYFDGSRVGLEPTTLRLTAVKVTVKYCCRTLLSAHRNILELATRRRFDVFTCSKLFKYVAVGFNTSSLPLEIVLEAEVTKAVIY